MEARLASAFTALETIVNGISETADTAETITGRPFYRLRSQLEQKIKEFAAHEDTRLDEVTVDALCSKLTELRRAPLMPRIIAAIAEYAVEWRHYWPEDTDLQEALQRAYERRSALLHTGRLEGGPQPAADLIRIQAVTERLLYAIVGGKEEWIDVTAEEWADFASRQPV